MRKFQLFNKSPGLANLVDTECKIPKKYRRIIQQFCPQPLANFPTFSQKENTLSNPLWHYSPGYPGKYFQISQWVMSLAKNIYFSHRNIDF